MRTNMRKTISIIFTIWTVIVLFIVYKNVEFPFVFQFVIGYIAALLLACVCFIINIFFHIRKSKWSTIKKMLFKFIIGSFVIWALNVLLIYLTKGELIIMDKVFHSIVISFVISFGDLIFEKRSEINEYNS